MSEMLLEFTYQSRGAFRDVRIVSYVVNDARVNPRVDYGNLIYMCRGLVRGCENKDEGSHY